MKDMTWHTPHGVWEVNREGCDVPTCIGCSTHDRWKATRLHDLATVYGDDLDELAAAISEVDDDES